MPSRDVTNQTLSGWELLNYFRPGRVWHPGWGREKWKLFLQCMNLHPIPDFPDIWWQFLSFFNSATIKIQLFTPCTQTVQKVFYFTPPLLDNCLDKADVELARFVYHLVPCWQSKEIWSQERINIVWKNIEREYVTRWKQIFYMIEPWELLFFMY